MGINVSHYCTKVEFELGRLQKAFQAIIQELGLDLDENHVYFTANYSHGGGTTEDKYLKLEDLATIRTIETHPSSLTMHFHSEKNGPSASIGLNHMFGMFLMGCSAPNVEMSQKMMSVLKDHLGLETIEKPSFGIDNNEDEINAQQQKTPQSSVVTKTGELCCFLSYRFSECSRVLALEVTRYLELLGVTVMTGAGYEPRRVADKVIDRLSKPHDFFIYLITKEGESTWTRDEVAVALGRGYAVILLVESGVQLGKGLLGDWEYLQFDGEHIGDTFLGILEALRFIRATKEGSVGMLAEPIIEP